MRKNKQRRVLRTRFRSFDEARGKAGLVQVLDMNTRGIITIPSAELAPGMIQANVEGNPGTVWVDVAQAVAVLEPSPYRHPPLCDDLRNRIRLIKTALDEVAPKSLDEWEDGFRRDRNIEGEIKHWEHIATVYSELKEKMTISTPERGRDIFRILVTCSLSSPTTALQVSALGNLSRAEATQVVQAYFNLPADVS